MARNKKTIIRRIPYKLDNVIVGFKNKNNIKYTDAAELAADLLMTRKDKKKIIENIRREWEL